MAKSFLTLSPFSISLCQWASAAGHEPTISKRRGGSFPSVPPLLAMFHCYSQLSWSSNVFKLVILLVVFLGGILSIAMTKLKVPKLLTEEPFVETTFGRQHIGIIAQVMLAFKKSTSTRASTSSRHKLLTQNK